MNPEMPLPYGEETLSGDGLRSKKRGWSSTAMLYQGGLNAQGVGQTNGLVLAADFSPHAVEFMIQFQVTGLGTGANAASQIPARPIATVSWMVENGTITRRFDVNNGMTFTGVGQSVNVRVDDMSDPKADFNKNYDGANYSVTCTVVPGTRPAQNQPPTLWEGLHHILKASGVTVEIPKDAGVISVEVTGYSINPPLNVQVSYVSGGVTLKTWDLVAFPGFIPVPPYATELTITNQDTGEGHAADISVQWGIDG